MGGASEGSFAELEERLNLASKCEKLVNRGVLSEMKIVVGPIAQSGLETRVGPNLPAAINAALVYYVGKLNSGRRPVDFPKFGLLQGERRDGATPSTGRSAEIDPRPEVEVEIDERIEAALSTDAKRQGVDLADLAGHAILVYLAELDLIGDPGTPHSRRAYSLAGSVRNATHSAN
jgi:hypothetical protein